MFRNQRSLNHKSLALLLLLSALVLPRAVAQTCSSASEMDEPTRSALERTARQFFDYASQGDVFHLKQAAASSLAANFAGVEGVVIDQKPIYAGAQPTVRASYLLEAPGNTPLARAEFLCGVWATSSWASFVINNLPPGRYGVVIQDVSTPKGKYAFTLVLRQEGGAWKLAGYYSKPEEIGGHDSQWFLTKAREYKTKGANLNAWFYYLTAWDLAAPVDFMSTRALDKISDEMEGVRPSNLPSSDHPLALAASGGRSYQVIYLSALPAGNDLNLLVKYRMPDVSNTQKMFDENMAVIRAIVARYPEFREAFAGVVARATEPSGRDYGTLLAMKDVK
ncbi:MAG: hypothetical protein WA188_16835 [Terriglobales bacterium]